LNSRIKYFYYTELCKIDSSLKNKNMECTSIQILLKELRNKILDVSLLKKLSEDFNWDYQYILVTQVVTLLNSQELEFTVATDVFGKDTISIKTSVEEITAICQPYVNEISKRELLNTELRKFAESINFYFYELYLAVFQILQHINCFPRELDLQKNILLFLKNKMTTKRRNRLSQIETDLFLHSQSDAGVLPKIAKYRLPFMPLIKEPLKNILGKSTVALRTQIFDIQFYFIILRKTNGRCTPESVEIQKLCVLI
jgi:kinetochore-associated protein 1